MAESDDDFLKRTGAVVAPSASESDDDFLKRTGAAPQAAPQKPAQPSSQIISEYGGLVDESAQPTTITDKPLNDAAARVRSAAATAYRETPDILTPQAQTAISPYVGSASGVIGRYINAPAGNILNAGWRGLNALGAGAGQAAYEAGATVGGPALGRDLYMAQQVAPAVIASPLIPPRMAPAGETASTPRFVQEYYGEGTPGNPLEAPLPAGFQLGTTKPSATGPISLTKLPEYEKAPAAAEPITAADVVPRTSAEAKNIASQHYAYADSVGANLNPQLTNNFLDTVKAAMPQTAAGKATVGDSAVTKLLERYEDPTDGIRDQPLSLQGAQEIDEGLTNLITKEYGLKGITKDGLQLQQVQQQFRNMIQNPQPGDITGSSAGIDAWNQGKAAWSQAMKMRDLEAMNNRAQLAEKPDTAFRSYMRTYLNNAKNTRGLTPDEVDAFKEAANKGFIGSALSLAGSKLIPIMAGAAELGTHGVTAGAATYGVAHGLNALVNKGVNALQQSRYNNAMQTLGSRVPPAPNLQAPPPTNILGAP